MSMVKSKLVMLSTLLLLLAVVCEATIYPHDLLNLTNWYLQLPCSCTGSTSDGTYCSVKQTSLATYSLSPYFYIPDDDMTAVKFVAPTRGLTTSGSTNPRSELREMVNGGKTSGLCLLCSKNKHHDFSTLSRF
jgi:hypothetical protein